ncbi:MAG: hypothetical protein PVI38_16290 [Desulfobacterales bacterium]|jgi:hypothetical protein
MHDKIEDNLLPKAKKIWLAIPADIRLKILDNVWCVQCKEITGIGKVRGNVESGMLVLRGVCTRCGGEVARVIEHE